MKKFNKNIILFIAVFLFLITGLCSKRLAVNLFHSLENLCRNVVSGKGDAFQTFTEELDRSSEMLKYHNEMLDISSAKNNLSGARIVFDSEMTIVKADSGVLLGYMSTTPYSEEFLQDEVDNIKYYQTLAEANGAGFLYCERAEKSSYETLPPNYISYTAQYKKDLFQAILDNDIPCMSSSALFEEYGMAGEDIFFKTDHHWTPKAGFLVHSGICEKLQELYGFEYNAQYTDLGNYIIETYENWFLGGYGKKCGAYFAGNRVDDFDLITPKFETNFTEEIPTINSTRSGSFEDTMLHKRHLAKGYYEYNAYAAYSGGDFRLQKITNNNLEDGKKIVVIRNSFACVVTPFLALHAKELHVIDLRSGSYPVGEIIDIEAYIREIQPDYVIYLT